MALDARRDAAGTWRLPVHGWTETGDATLQTLLAYYVEAGARHVLCTDIERDGMLAGPSTGLYRQLTARWPGLALQASGGVRDAADVTAAGAAGCTAVILGRALLEGRLALRDVLGEAAPC